MILISNCNLSTLLHLVIYSLLTNAGYRDFKYIYVKVTCLCDLAVQVQIDLKSRHWAVIFFKLNLSYSHEGCISLWWDAN